MQNSTTIEVYEFKWLKLLRSESPSGKCAKLHTVAANNNRDHAPRSLSYCLFAPRIYGCCSSRTSRSWWIAHSRNANGEVATVHKGDAVRSICKRFY